MSLKCGSTIYFANLLSPGVPSVASGNGRAQPNSSWCGRAGRVPPSLTTVRVPSKNSAVAIVLRFADRSAIRPVMVRWLGILLGTLRSTIRTRRELALENLALRQQLAVWKARQPRPRLTAMDRIFWVVLSRLWKGWRNSLQVVRPETVVGWHRQGFRRCWAWKSRRRRGRPMIRTELRDLIRRMSRANPLWGAPRIHGELLKLGLTVSQATRSTCSGRGGRRRRRGGRF